jgi:hypothetical protein
MPEAPKIKPALGLRNSRENVECCTSRIRRSRARVQRRWIDHKRDLSRRILQPAPPARKGMVGKKKCQDSDY